jgi:hypothetical protein
MKCRGLRLAEHVTARKIDARNAFRISWKRPALEVEEMEG